MPERGRPRLLAEHLARWSAEQVAGLLARRPDLAAPRAPRDLAELARRAESADSLAAAFAATTLAENRLLQVVVCCGPDLSGAELARALPDGMGLGDVEAVLASLEHSALLWRTGERIHSSPVLSEVVPTTLGPPIRRLLQRQHVEMVRAAVSAVRSAVGGGAALSVPGRRAGGGAPRKAELIEELAQLLSRPEVVEAVLATGSPDAVRIARNLATPGRQARVLPGPLYTYGYGDGPPTTWLYRRALLLPTVDGGGAVVPREVGLALCDGRPVADLALDRPPLATRTVHPGEVDDVAAVRASLTLDRLAELLERWAEAPVKTLKSGGLGATAMKQTAAALETDVEEAARLVELAVLAGLVDLDVRTKRVNRTYVSESFVVAGSAATPWLEQPPGPRWCRLAGAWLRARRWPSVAGRKGPDGTKALPVLSPQEADRAPERRAEVLAALLSLDSGVATTPEDLAAAVYWRRPQPWLRVGLPEWVDPPTIVRWVYDEAELLGVAAGGALSSFGRAIAGADAGGAERALEAALPAPVTTFTLQGDLTATVVGALARGVMVELRLLADVEATGGATTMRFSDASLRRGLDAGRDAASILAFLEAHADKGVPPALSYLVADVARRYGHLRVSSAQSFVTSEDPAVLADACSHRRTRNLALRLLAPTVAVSPHDGAKVLGGLREAGFLPIGEGDAPASVALTRPAPSGRPPPGELPEPFRARAAPRPAPALDPAEAATLAAAILAGPPPAPEEQALAFGVAEAGTVDDDPHTIVMLNVPGDTAELMALFEQAMDEVLVVAVSLGDPELAEPILMVVTGLGPGDEIVGLGLVDGSTISILAGQVGAVLDLGPLDELTDVGVLRPRRPDRRRRGRR